MYVSADRATLEEADAKGHFPRRKADSYVPEGLVDEVERNWRRVDRSDRACPKAGRALQGLKSQGWLQVAKRSVFCSSL